MDDQGLSGAERAVWGAFPTGSRVDLSSSEDRRIRAWVLRLLLLGAVPTDAGERAALRLDGAEIVDRLDLSYADVDAPISLRECRFEVRPDLYGARLRRLTLSDSELPGLNVGSAEIAGDLDLTGARVSGELSLAGARIGGSLLLNRAVLSADGPSVGPSAEPAAGPAVGPDAGPAVGPDAGRALDGTRMSVTQAVSAGHGFECHGELRLDSADVGGSMRLAGATLSNAGGWALYASGLRVGAVLDLSGNARIDGAVRLRSAVIDVLSLSVLIRTEPGDVALDLRSLTATEMVLRFGTPPAGRVDLGYARIGLLHDDPTVLPAELILDGLTYSSVEEMTDEPLSGPAQVRRRLRWLERDPRGFRPQAYAMLVTAYRSAGRDDDARTVSLAGERHRRRSLSWPGRLWGRLQDLTVGYGYQPVRAALWLLLLLAAGTLVFTAVEPRPAEAPKAPEFHALAYAADLLLPVIDLGQQSAYLPRGWTAWFAYFLIGSGLLFATTAVAAIARRLQRS